ncbi:MAG TPA: hypothetical protein VNT03_09315 [Baekduia sp.]|nr:hypothetical protein [Baekduia sp.]
MSCSWKAARAALRRHAAMTALVLSMTAVVLSGTGLADAARKAVTGKVVRLNSAGRIPGKYLPKVAPRARTADRLGDQAPEDLADGCPATSTDLGTWCLMASPYPLDPGDAGKNNYFFASQKCVELGGWLPTAAQLIGAANRVFLASVLSDSQAKGSIDIEPSDGLKDRREMSSTLITTSAGSSAAGSEGVSDGAKGDPRTGEPDPVPQPANSAPDTLQYVTVFDNGDKGGFAGAKPVSQPETFRCAFGRTQSKANGVEATG